MISGFLPTQKISPHARGVKRPPRGIKYTGVTCETFIGEPESAEYLTGQIQNVGLHAIAADTGSGKTSFIREIAAQGLFNTVFLLCPNIATGTQQKAKLEKEGLRCVLLNCVEEKPKGLKAALQCADVVIPTYQWFIMLLQSQMITALDLVVIDEAHKLGDEPNPKNSAGRDLFAVCEAHQLLHLCPVVLLSATPEYDLFSRWGANILTVTQTNPRTPLPKGTVYEIETKGSLRGAVREIVEEFSEGVTLVLCNSIKAGRYATQHTPNSCFICSDTVQSEAEGKTKQYLLDNGRPPEGITTIFTTSVIVDGVDLEFYFDTLLIIDERNLRTIKQIKGRARKGVGNVKICLSEQTKKKNPIDYEEELQKAQDLCKSLNSMNIKGLRPGVIQIPEENAAFQAFKHLYIDQHGKYAPNIAAIHQTVNREKTESTTSRDIAREFGFELVTGYYVEKDPEYSDYVATEKKADKLAFKRAFLFALQHPKDAALYVAQSQNYAPCIRLARSTYKGFNHLAKQKNPFSPESIPKLEKLTSRDKEALSSATFWALRILNLGDVVDLTAMFSQVNSEAQAAKLFRILHAGMLYKRKKNKNKIPAALQIEATAYTRLRAKVRPRAGGTVYSPHDLEKISRVVFNFTGQKQPEIFSGRNRVLFSQVFDLKRVRTKADNSSLFFKYIIKSEVMTKQREKHGKITLDISDLKSLKPLPKFKYDWRLSPRNFDRFCRDYGLKPKARPTFTDKEGGVIC